MPINISYGEFIGRKWGFINTPQFDDIKNYIGIDNIERYGIQFNIKEKYPGTIRITTKDMDMESLNVLYDFIYEFTKDRYNTRVDRDTCFREYKLEEVI